MLRAIAVYNVSIRFVFGAFRLSSSSVCASSAFFLDVAAADLSPDGFLIGKAT